MLKKEKFLSIIKITLTYLLMVGGLTGLVYWFWKNPIYNPAGAQPQQAKTSIEVRFKGAVVRGRKGGVPYWTVYSNNVEVERNSPMVFFRDKPKGEFYNLKDWSKNTTEQEKNPANNISIPGNNPNNPGGTNPSGTPVTTNDERLRTFTWSADLAEYNTDNEDLILKKSVKILTDCFNMQNT